jgi:hypothetical protein
MSTTQNEREDREESSTQQMQELIYKEMATQILRSKGLSRAELIKRANRPQHKRVHKKRKVRTII